MQHSDAAQQQHTSLLRHATTPVHQEQVLFPVSTRDLINIGIFTVLYFVAVAICGQLGALIPLLQILGPLYIPIIAGIPFALFLTRVHKFGMISIMGILVGLLVLATGQAYWVAVFALVLAPLADWIAKTGSYQAWGRLVASYAVFWHHAHWNRRTPIFRS